MHDLTSAVREISNSDFVTPFKSQFYNSLRSRKDFAFLAGLKSRMQRQVAVTVAHVRAYSHYTILCAQRKPMTYDQSS